MLPLSLARCYHRRGILSERTRAAAFYIHLVRVNLAWVDGAPKYPSAMITMNCSFPHEASSHSSQQRRNHYLPFGSLSPSQLWVAVKIVTGKLH
jgi:hypothetical protein